MMNVKVVSEQTLGPSRSTPTHLRYLKASLFDHANFPIFMPIIFFYSPTPNSTITTKEFLYRLKTSFPTTLSVFYPLAGRVLDMNGITCNDEGVPYIEAQVSGSYFGEFIHNAEVSQLDMLLPYHGGKELFTRLLLAVQVNVFPCGGVAVALKTSHALCDAMSKVMFVKTWADIANGKDFKSRPCFEIYKLFPPTLKRQDVFESFKPDLNTIKDARVTKWFRFSKAKLDELRSKLKRKSNLEDNSRPSLFMVLSAFIMSRINFLCTKYNADNIIIPSEVYCAVNIRSKVNPPKDSYFFGNMSINAVVKVKPCMIETSSSDQSLCVDFMNDLRASTRKIMNDTIMSIENVQEGLSSMSDHFYRARRGEIMSYGFSNARGMLIYGADFGWGQPVWVTSASVQANIVLILPAEASSEDIIAFMNLNDEQMTKLTSDIEFLSFVSSQSSSKL